MNNRCQLITYPDSLGANLQELSQVVASHFAESIGGIHLLPFYPSSADRGFAPITYDSVDPVFGSWEDIERLAADFEVVADFMYNHISRQSAYFLDYLANGSRSRYADMFIRFSQFWPEGGPTEEDLARIYTRKPRPPYLEIDFSDGTAERVWCTFDYEQIDLNLQEQVTKSFVEDTLRTLCSHGIRMIRLDAFAYATKRPGTSCFFVEPDVWELLDFARRIVEPYDVELLPEVHEHYSFQKRIESRGYWVYDFALPFLFLQAFYMQTAKNLKRWLSICPRKQITTLDTHDGIGVVDVRDLITEEEIQKTRDLLYQRGANVKRIYSTAKFNNLDIYQINCTFFSALGERDTAYLMARAVQFFTPGIPQVYYVGLLAGSNDIDLVENKTRTGRDINRHPYTIEEIDREVKRPVVRKLLELMRLRNTHPAFNGAFSLLDGPDDILSVEWRSGDTAIRLDADFARIGFRISEVATTGTSVLVEE